MGGYLAGRNGGGVEDEVLIGAEHDRGAFDGRRGRIEAEVTGETRSI